MLWLCLHFPRLPAEALNLRDPLDVVTDSRGPRRWLVTAGPEAAVGTGTALGTALSIRSDLRAHARRSAAERVMLRNLAHLLYRYGAPVACDILERDDAGHVPRAWLWLEIGASLRLFGGFEPLLAQLRSELDELQQCLQWAVAPTRAGAALLSLSQPGARLWTLAALEAQLARLPIRALLWPRAVEERLDGMGLRRIGELWRLPRAGFARRFGEHSLLELDRLRGMAPDPVRAVIPPPRFRRRFDFASEVEGVEGLLFPLRRLAFELQGWLRARDLGVLSLQLESEHADKRRHQVNLRLLAAHRDGARLFEALRERLGRETLPGAVRALTLKAQDTAATAAGQASLFASDEETQLQWQAAVERLMARLGEDAVWTPQHHEDHRPERASVRRVPGQPDSPRSLPRRPLWLLPTPQPLPRPPQVMGAEERIESGWWEGADAARDYYRATLSGAQAWVYRDRGNGRWYLHGWWA